MTVKEIKDRLISLGVSKDEVEKLGKKEARLMMEKLETKLDTEDAIQEAQDHGMLFPMDQKTEEPKQSDDVKQEPVVETVVAMPEETREIPNIDDENWTEYVLSQISENEKSDGIPKADGLRRFARKLYGRDLNIRVDPIQVPEPSNGYHATVKCTIIVNNQVFEACADCYSENTPKEYAIHAIGTAESRAEGRALRKLLNLTGIFTAEEKIEPPGDDNIRISQSVLSGLKTMCHKEKINIEKLLSYLNIDAQDIATISKAQGKQIIESINNFRREGIPEVIKES